MTGAVLSLDAGTTLIKAVVFDEDGREIAGARRPAEMRTPAPGRSEQDIALVVSAALEAVSEVAAASPLPIGAIAVTAQGDGFWPLDGSGAPVGAAVLWNDGRSRPLLDRWLGDGTAEEAFRISGSALNLGLPNAIVRSMLDDDPRALDEVAWIATCGTALFAALTGVVAAHASEASAPWLDVRTGEYSAELLDLYGLPQVGDLLPEVVGVRDAARPLRSGMAEALGVGPDVPVVLAPYDVVTTAAGAGALARDRAFAVLGTTLCTGTLAERSDTAGPPAGLTLHTGEGDRLLRAFPTLSGVGVLEWLARMIGSSDAAAAVARAEESPAGARGVRFWPYLSPSGERAPFLDPDASGVLAGLEFGSGPADLARAVVESLGHVVRDGLDSAEADPVEIALCGGGAASDEICRAVADITGVPVVRTEDAQVGAKGAMVAALVALGEVSVMEEAAAGVVRDRDRFEPDPATRALHDDRHDDFLSSRDALRTRWGAWSGRRHPAVPAGVGS